jgi:hypothetical protein
MPDATREGLKQALARATACRDALSPRP